MNEIESACKYPYSAELFRFCKDALSIRYDSNVKVIDQDVGAILGYDPADCSHWKKGKKNIHVLVTLKNLARHLEVDEHILMGIVSGGIDYEEAIFEFKGYGSFGLSHHEFESFKKDFFKNPEKWKKARDTKHSFKFLFTIDQEKIYKLSEFILDKGNFKEAPISLEKLFSLYKNLNLKHDPNSREAYSVRYTGKGRSMQLTWSYREKNMKGYIRFLAAREIYCWLLKTEAEEVEVFRHHPEVIQKTIANIFASYLLVPRGFLRQEVDRASSYRDLIEQESDVFCVSKLLINERIRHYLEYRL